MTRSRLIPVQAMDPVSPGQANPILHGDRIGHDTTGHWNHVSLGHDRTLIPLFGKDFVALILHS